MKKKKIIITIVLFLVFILIMWISGIIPILITLGQGLFSFEEEYREKYENIEQNTYSKIIDNTLIELNNSIEYNRTPENVDIKIDDETVKPTNVSIIITDNNEYSYGWGVEFRVQKKIDGQWKDLEYVIDNVSWIEIAYELNENNQLTQNLDIDKYYGKLSAGTYRIVKPVYDNGYIDIYSNEFEIK